METLMASTGWADLVVHLTDAAAWEGLLGEKAIDRVMVTQWADDAYQDKLMWDDATAWED